MNASRGVEDRLNSGDRRMKAIEDVIATISGDLREVKEAIIGSMENPGGLVAATKSVDGRVKSLEGWRLVITSTLVWIWRTAAGAAIVTLVGYVFFLHGIPVPK